MGKRKRRADNNKAAPPPSDSTQEAPQADLQSGQRTSGQAASCGAESQAPNTDVMDNSLKRSAHPPPQSTLNQNHGPSRTTLLRHCRPPSSRHYSRRSFTNHPDASPSNWKGSFHDSMISCRMESKDLFQFPYRDTRDRAFQKQERIRSNLLVQNTLCGDVRRMECTICQKRLRKNPFASENPISSTDLSVVAVLVCGHAYHADCLEQKMSHDADRQDPPCPLCEGQIS